MPSWSSSIINMRRRWKPSMLRATTRAALDELLLESLHSKLIEKRWNDTINLRDSSNKCLFHAIRTLLGRVGAIQFGGDGWMVCYKLMKCHQFYYKPMGTRLLQCSARLSSGNRSGAPCYRITMNARKLNWTGQMALVPGGNCVRVCARLCAPCCWHGLNYVKPDINNAVHTLRLYKCASASG